MKTGWLVGSVAVVGFVAAGATGHLSLHSRSEPVPMVLKGARDAGDPAVVEMWVDDSMCSGTVIAPRYVLTAAHCVRDIDDIDAHPIHVVGQIVSAVHLPPNAELYENDVAVLELPRPTSIEPMPVNLDARALSNVESIRMVGFGLSSTYADDSEVKRSGFARAFMTPNFVKTVPGTGGICYGDSGGPALATIDGKETLIGVTSYSEEEECEHGSAFVRTDRQSAFLARFIDDSASDAPPPPPPDRVAEEDTNENDSNDSNDQADPADPDDDDEQQFAEVDVGQTRITLGPSGVTVIVRN